MVEVNFEDCWDSVRPKRSADGSTKGLLWLGLLEEVPYKEVSVKGYHRRAVPVDSETFRAVFQVEEIAPVRGVALYAADTRGVPIYWQKCQLIYLPPSFEFDVNLTIKRRGEPVWPELMQLLGVA